MLSMLMSLELEEPAFVDVLCQGRLSATGAPKKKSIFLFSHIRLGPFKGNLCKQTRVDFFGFFSYKLQATEMLGTNCLFPEIPNC